MKRYRVALLGYYGFGNLGDDLLLQACIELLTRCGLEREKIIVLSNSPEIISQNFQVDAVNRWKFRDVVRALRESDSLLLGGGGIFQDATSLKSCVWYWAVLRLAKFFGCRLWALGQSVGPLKSRSAKFFAGDALRLCEILHVRDENSLNVAKNLGCEKISLGCDLVITLGETPPLEGGNKRGGEPITIRTSTQGAGEPPNITATAQETSELSTVTTTARGEKNTTLLNLRPSKNLSRYIEIISPHLKEKNILGVALSPEDVYALKNFPGLKNIFRVKNFSEARKFFSCTSSCVGMRLHFGVLSRIFGVPLALLPYDVKVSEFAKQSGVPVIIDEWQDPAAPLPVPENAREVEELCKKFLSL